MNRYPLTKLNETFSGRCLARELVPVSKTGVIINIVCPGLCVAKLGRHSPQAFVARLRDLYAKYGLTGEGGSRTMLQCAA